MVPRRLPRRLWSSTCRLGLAHVLTVLRGRRPLVAVICFRSHGQHSFKKDCVGMFWHLCCGALMGQGKCGLQLQDDHFGWPPFYAKGFRSLHVRVYSLLVRGRTVFSLSLHSGWCSSFPSTAWDAKSQSTKRNLYGIIWGGP